MSELTAEQQLRIAALDAAANLCAHYPRWGSPLEVADGCLSWLKRGESDAVPSQPVHTEGGGGHA